MHHPKLIDVAKIIGFLTVMHTIPEVQHPRNENETPKKSHPPKRLETRLLQISIIMSLILGATALLTYINKDFILTPFFILLLITTILSTVASFRASRQESSPNETRDIIKAIGSIILFFVLSLIFTQINIDYTTITTTDDGHLREIRRTGNIIGSSSIYQSLFTALIAFGTIAAYRDLIAIILSPIPIPKQ